MTWSVKLDALTDTQITYRYTFLGEIGFITSQPCNNPAPIALPFDRVSLSIDYSASNVPGKPTSPPEEFLLANKLDYQAPTFVNCWNLANPPAFYPGAISYVRYQGLRFSSRVEVPRSSYFAQELGHAVTFSASTNANPDGVTFVGVSIPVPSISANPSLMPTTTTTPKRSSTTTVVPGEETTTTLIDGETTTTTEATDNTAPDRNASPDGIDATASVDGVALDLVQETPKQEQTRKEHTADSIAITVAVLASSLAAVAPTVGAAGAAGGIVGVMTARGFGGGDLLPQTPRPESYSVRRRVLPRMKPRSLPAKEEITLKNPFDAPQNFSQEGERTSGSRSDQGSTFHKRFVASIQTTSKVPALRPGLRRFAEVSIVSPALAAAIPMTALCGSAALAMAFDNGTVGFVTVSTVLFLLSFLAPILSVLVACGWFVGRVVLSPTEAYVAACESLALLPGLLLIPAMARSIIGPPERSRTWEWYASLVLTPVVTAYAFRGWLTSLNAQVKTLVTLAPDVVGRARSGVNMSITADSALAVAVLFAVLTVGVAVLAVVYSEDSGTPMFMLEKWIRHDDPAHQERIACIECSTLEAPVPHRWFKSIAYALVATTSALVLSPILQWKAYVLIGVFLLGVSLSRKFADRGSIEVHPIVKKIPMVFLGLALGSFAVSPGRAFLAFGLITVTVLATLRVRTRQLWP